MKKLLIALCLMTLLLCSCGRQEIGQEGLTTVILYKDNVLRLQMEPDIHTLDPAYVSTDNELLLSRLLYNGLLKKDGNKIIRDLAASWSISADGRVYHFSIDENACFGNGNALTAIDVKYSFERLLKSNSPYAYLFNNIKGASALLNDETIDLEGITVEGNAVIIELEDADYRFAAKLCHIGASVISRQECMAAGVDFAKPSTVSQYKTLPSGSGIYRITEWLDGQNIALSANTHKNEAPVNRVEIDLHTETSDALLKLKWHELDAVMQVLPSDTPLDMNYKALSLMTMPQRSFMSVIINPNWQYGEQMPLANAETRLALLDIIDADILNTQLNEGQYLIDSGLTDYWYTVNTSTAIAKPIAVGKGSIQEELPRLSIACTDGEASDTALAISRMLGEKGIASQVTVYSDAALTDKILHNNDIAIFIYSYADRGNELMDFYHLFQAATLPETDNSQNNEDAPTDNEESKDESEEPQEPIYIWPLSDNSRRLLDSIISSSNKALDDARTNLTKVEKELTEQGYFKLLWFKKSDTVYNEDIRGLNNKLTTLFDIK